MSLVKQDTKCFFWKHILWFVSGVSAGHHYLMSVHLVSLWQQPTTTTNKLLMFSDRKRHICFHWLFTSSTIAATEWCCFTATEPSTHPASKYLFFNAIHYTLVFKYSKIKVKGTRIKINFYYPVIFPLIIMWYVILMGVSWLDS